MANIEPRINGRRLAPRAGRYLDRTISVLQVSREVRAAEIYLETDLVIDKVQNITLATGAGMNAIANVGQAQRQLELLAPETSARMALIADSHALHVADTLSHLATRLRRI